jgi:hypothetical protein
MRHNYLIQLAFLALITIGFSSCEPTEDTGYTIPSTYNFDNVSYSGQTERLDMLGEIVTYIKTAHSATASPLDASMLKSMYANDSFAVWDNNGTYGKNLRSKTSAAFQDAFDTYLDAAALASQSTGNTASNGTAGVISKNDNTSTYLLNENGMELAQIIDKGLMGACFYYQGTNVYLGSGKMDADNTDVVPGEGTEMEHHWDEAFGYFGVPVDFPTNTTGIRYWGKYCNKHEDVDEYPLNAKMMDAFLKGRAAISANDLTTRDAQIAEIQMNWELVVGATAIYYLNSVIDGLGNDAGSDHHGLSEGFAFIMSLKFGATGSITSSEVDAILVNLFGSADPLQANVYDAADLSKLEAARDAIAGYLTELESCKLNL